MFWLHFMIPLFCAILFPAINIKAPTTLVFASFLEMNSLTPPGGQDMGVSKNRGGPPTSSIFHFNRLFHYKPSILGYPYFWKHPYLLIQDWDKKNQKDTKSTSIRSAELAEVVDVRLWLSQRNILVHFAWCSPLDCLTGAVIML